MIWMLLVLLFWPTQAQAQQPVTKGQTNVNSAMPIVCLDPVTFLPEDCAGSGGPASGDGAILDGVSSAIKATVFDYTNSNPLAARIVDANGTPYTAIQVQPDGTNWSLTGTSANVNITNGSLPVTGTFWQATQPVSGTFWQATQPVSGTFWQATQPVSGPLTDAQLRATPVPVSGTVTATGPLTDAQLRATPVPVTDKVSTAIFNGQQAVTASAVALPSNSATEVCVKAMIGNTINVYVGTSAVTISTGLELAPGDAYCVKTDNSSDLLVIASTTGASVSFAGRN